MSNNELEILLTLRDKATAQLKKFQTFTKRSLDAMRKNWLILTAAIVATTLVLKKLVGAMVTVATEVVKVNAKFETWTTTMKTFTKDTAEAKAVLKELIDFSVKTPFTPGEVVEAGLLLKPLEAAGFELNKLVLAAGNLKEAFGFNSLGEAAENLSRALNAGVASAELFKQKGVTTFFQFEKGIDITNAKLEDQQRILLETFTTGKIGGAIERASKDFNGLSSTLEGLFLLFKRDIGVKAFEKAKLLLKVIVDLLLESLEKNGKWEEVVTSLDSAFSDMFDTAVNGAGMLFVAAGQTLDILNEIKAVIKGIEFSWLIFISGLVEANILIGELMSNLPGGKSFIDVEANKAALAEILADIEKVTGEILDLRTKADVDYSKKFEAIVNKISAKYIELKKIIILTNKGIKDANDDLGDDLNDSTKKSLNVRIKTWLTANKVMIEASISMAQTTASIMGELATMTGKTWLKTAEVVINAVVSAVKVIIAAVNASLGPLGFLKAALEITAVTLASINAIKQIKDQEAALEAINTQTIQPVTSVTALAEGGIVSRPTLALIGEAGPEAVVPLGSSGGFRNINIEVNISEPQVRSLDDIFTLSEEVSDQVAKEIERL